MTRNGGKKLRRRGRPGLKLRRKHWLIYGPLIVLALVCNVGYYVIDLYEHPSLWNGIVYVAAAIFGTVVFLWLEGKSRR